MTLLERARLVEGQAVPELVLTLTDQALAEDHARLMQEREQEVLRWIPIPLPERSTAGNRTASPGSRGTTVTQADVG